MRQWKEETTNDPGSLGLLFAVHWLQKFNFVKEVCGDVKKFHRKWKSHMVNSKCNMLSLVKTLTSTRQ
jgi:hypothetical protein